MKVSRKESRHVAELARLHLPDPELDRLTRDLNSILEHVDALAELTREVGGPGEAPSPAPDASPEVGTPGVAEDGEEGPLREGTGGAPDLLRRSLSDLAPEWRDGFFTVPRLPALHEDDPADSAGASG